VIGPSPRIDCRRGNGAGKQHHQHQNENFICLHFSSDTQRTRTPSSACARRAPAVVQTKPDESVVVGRSSRRKSLSRDRRCGVMVRRAQKTRAGAVGMSKSSCVGTGACGRRFTRRRGVPKASRPKHRKRSARTVGDRPRDRALRERTIQDTMSRRRQFPDPWGHVAREAKCEREGAQQVQHPDLHGLSHASGNRFRDLHA
jgi:hypothetical protein